MLLFRSKNSTLGKSEKTLGSIFFECAEKFHFFFTLNLKHFVSNC